MKIYIQSGSSESGPFSLEEIVERVRYAGLSPDLLCRTDGDANWKPLRLVVSIVSTIPVSSPTPPPLPPPLPLPLTVPSNVVIFPPSSALPPPSLPPIARLRYEDRPFGLFALFGIMIVNVAIYALMAWKLGLKTFSPKEVVIWGGLFAPLVKEGEVWRMLTANYLHFDLKHIAFNMIALLNWGQPVALRLGFLRFVLFYALAGISGSVASLYFHPQAACAGASGAVTGILGALIVMRIQGDENIRTESLVQAAAYNLIIPFIVPSIDWQAHVGGLLAGIILGFINDLTLTNSHSQHSA